MNDAITMSRILSENEREDDNDDAERPGTSREKNITL